MSKECACHKCISACEHNPGWFAPGEPEKAAAYLNQTMEEFSKNLITDYWGCEKTGKVLYVTAPRKVGVDADRSVASWEYPFVKAPCVFLKNGRCSIHAVKPRECRDAMICKKTFGSREAIAREWEEHRAKNA